MTEVGIRKYAFALSPGQRIKACLDLGEQRMPASYEEILTKITTELSRLTPSDVELHEDSDLITELGLDSFKVLDLLLDIEDEFDISMPVNLLADVHTVKDLAARIHSVINSST